MRVLGPVAVAVLLAACAAAEPSPAASPGETTAGAEPYEVLVFTRTTGFRHDSIPAGIQAVRDLGRSGSFRVTATEDPALFTAAGLAGFAAVVFLNTSGDVLDSPQQAAFEAYVRGGGGYVGVHGAADTEYGWAFYGELVGARFARHPAIQPVTVRVEDRAHPATAHLPEVWRRTDEPYDFRTNPRASVRVLATLDESSYTGGRMGADHPITWCRSVGAGRSFYTGLGHTRESYAQDAFRQLLLGGIRYAAGRAQADCRPAPGP